MTDWTKDDTDEDDKFWKWMDNDKENYNKKHPRKLKIQGKKKKKIIVSGIIGLALVVTIFVILSTNNEFSSEKYFYIPDYRLNKAPIFCAQEFSDPIFPDANDIMITKTSEAIKRWQNSIEQYTETEGVWNFEYRTISKGSIFEDFGCDATIMFERFPPVELEVVRGETVLSQYGLSDVIIFYIDPVSRDRIDSNVDLVITHEIGHVLGLGHPVFYGMDDERPFYIEDQKIFARSIMITSEIYQFLPLEMIYTITDYDVRAVVNLYGGGISNTPIFFGYLNYVIGAIVLFGIAFLVNKKLKEY